MKGMDKIIHKTLENSGVIFTGLGCACFVKAIVEAVKAAPKASGKYLNRQIEIANEKYEKEYGDNPDLAPNVVNLDELSRTETIKVCGPCYIPATAWALAGFGLCMGSAISDRKTIRRLNNSILALQAGFTDWKKKAKMIAGEQLDDEIERAGMEEKACKDLDLPGFDEKQTFYIPGQPFFEATLREVYEAEYLINREFAMQGHAYLNDLYEMLGIRKTKNGKKFGWDMMSGEAFYGYGWIDFVHRYYQEDDGLVVCEICTPFMPHPIFEYDHDYEELMAEREAGSDAPFRCVADNPERRSAKKTSNIME